MDSAHSRNLTNQKRLSALHDERYRLGQEHLREFGEPEHDLESTAVIHIRQHFDELIGQKSVASASSSTIPQSFNHPRSFFSGEERGPQRWLDSSGISAKRQCLDQEAELISRKSRILQLESEIQSLKSARQVAHVECETKINFLRQEFEAEQLKVSGLRAEYNSAIQRENEKEEEITAIKSEAQKITEELKSQVALMSKVKVQLQAELEDARRDMAEQLQKFTGEEQQLKVTLETLTSDLEHANEELRVQTLKAKDCDQLKLDIEAKNEELSKALQHNHELELQLSRLDEDSKLLKEREKKLLRLSEVEKENERLHDENQYLSAIQANNLLLKEKNESLETKLSKAENKCLQISVLEVQIQDLQKQLNEWHSFTKNIAEGLRNPENLKRHLFDLQRSNQILLDKNGLLEADCHSTKQRLDGVLDEMRVLKSRDEEKKIKLEQSSEFIRRLQRKLSLVHKEKEGYKSILESYEGEITMTADMRSAQRQRFLEESVAQLQSHVQGLEKELETSSATIVRYKRLEAKIDQPGSRRSSESGDVLDSSRRAIDNTDKKLIIQLRTNISDLESRLAKTEQEKEEYSVKLERLELQGGYDSSKMRVFHLSDNPFSQAQKKLFTELNATKEENRKLAAKLKVLEERGGGEGRTVGGERLEDLSTLADERVMASSSKELEDVKSQLASSELKNKRLMEEFKRASQELREVTYELLGYRIDILSTHRYKLINMYAESPDDFLLFQRSSSGSVEMLDSEYAGQCVDKMENYLGGRSADTTSFRGEGGSIPAFLSSITMELFNRRTMMMS